MVLCENPFCRHYHTLGCKSIGNKQPTLVKFFLHLSILSIFFSEQSVIFIHYTFSNKCNIIFLFTEWHLIFQIGSIIRDCIKFSSSTFFHRAKYASQNISLESQYGSNIKCVFVHYRKTVKNRLSGLVLDNKSTDNLFYHF